MTEKVRISFEPSHDSDGAPLCVVINPGILSFALRSQVSRFGLVGGADRSAAISGKLRGNRAAFTQMIESYGHEIEIVRAPFEAP